MATTEPTIIEKMQDVTEQNRDRLKSATDEEYSFAHIDNADETLDSFADSSFGVFDEFEIDSIINVKNDTKCGNGGDHRKHTHTVAMHEGVSVWCTGKHYQYRLQDHNRAVLLMYHNDNITLEQLKQLLYRCKHGVAAEKGLLDRMAPQNSG